MSTKPDTEQRPSSLPAATERIRAAVLGAAFGDALGWPQEGRANRVRASAGGSPRPSPVPFDWIRSVRFPPPPYEEQIKAGEYSDDTQLLIATARSVLKRESWWNHFTSKELPGWLLYQRGGGGATIRAAQVWSRGKAPWAVGVQERQKYFAAGGNGVAMRILAHAVVNTGDDKFQRARDEITQNGIATHGHPRALLGAIAYGYAAWQVLNLRSSLGYGELVSRMIENESSWTGLPALDSSLGWNAAATEIDPSYFSVWEQTREEILALLTQARDALEQGPLTVPHDTLKDLGCFDKSQSGSGTIAAAASIFLASYFATSPLNGVLEAAFAGPADTDTLASMTAGLLGAIAGLDWLSEYASFVQDRKFIEDTFLSLVSGTQSEVPAPVQIKLLDEAIQGSAVPLMNSSDLRRVGINNTVLLKDGRRARIESVRTLSVKSKDREAATFRLIAEDGQTLYVTDMIKKRAEVRPIAEIADPTQNERTVVLELIIALEVADLKRARHFYQDVLGLALKSETNNGPVFDGGIMLVSKPTREVNGERVAGVLEPKFKIAITTLNAVAVYQRVRKEGSEPFQPLSSIGDWTVFECLDPDRNIVRIIQKRNSLTNMPVDFHSSSRGSAT